MGKGKLSGAARKGINQRRADEITKGKPDDTEFGRVTKLLGHNHILVAIPTKTASKEIRVRITNLFTKRGATPITTRDIVAVFVGKDFDPEDIKPTDQFDMTAILSSKQMYQLVKSGDIPRWMTQDELSSDGAHKTEADQHGWEFAAESDEESESDEHSGHPTKAEKTLKSKKNAIVFEVADEDDEDNKAIAHLDIDAI